ncbi:MAG: EutN/CcmL family microcompartment protein [Candidatus Eisenbacteria bacterium]|nr:EutN/CcmL family microcompartment protein [Candidatus Eisenbacteria bacterium]
MILGDVIGTVTSTVKHGSLAGRRLLLVRPVTPEGEPSGETEIALDSVDAGIGDRVLVNREGRSAEAILGADGIPVRSVITAVVDEVVSGGLVAYRKGDAP